jgi:hypothetical protein
MEVRMELSKKTTILLSPDLHAFLAARAKFEGRSIGELIRDACVRQYRYATREERVRAFEELTALRAPVGTVEEMERESSPSPEELMP